MTACVCWTGRSAVVTGSAAGVETGRGAAVESGNAAAAETNGGVAAAERGGDATETTTNSELLLPVHTGSERPTLSSARHVSLTCVFVLPPQRTCFSPGLCSLLRDKVKVPVRAKNLPLVFSFQHFLLALHNKTCDVKIVVRVVSENSPSFCFQSAAVQE